MIVMAMAMMAFCVTSTVRWPCLLSSYPSLLLVFVHHILLGSKRHIQYSKGTKSSLFALMNALKVLGMDAVLLSHIGSLLSYASRMDHHFESSVYKNLKQSLYESLILDIPGLPDAGETEITSTGITCGASMSLSAQRARATDRTATKSPCGVFS